MKPNALLLLLACVAWLAGCSPVAPPSPTPTPPPSSPEAGKEVDVLIVGAGLSGLTTAYHLKQAGISYRVLELSPRVGGRARTATYPDQSQAEVGLAEFWTGNPALELAKRLNVELELAEPGMSSFMVDGKLYPFTDYGSNQEFIQACLGPEYAQYQQWDRRMEGLVRQVEAGSIPPELMKLKDVSFKDWLEQEKLSPLSRALVRAVLEPEIGTTIERISALDGIAEWHLFVGQGATPHHCVGGNEKLPLAIARAIGEDNISLNTQVTNVIDRPDGVEIRAVDTATYDTRIFKARYAVLTVPLFRLFEIQFVPRLDDRIYQAVHTQSWGAYFTAHCLMDKSAQKYWTVDGHSVLPILSGGALGCIYPGQDAGDAVMLNFLVTGPPAESFNSRTMSLDDVQKVMETEMDTIWPGSRKMIRRWTFYRYHPRAITSWPVGRSRFDELSQGLRKPHGRLYFGGDFTESSHSDGAMRSAIRVSGQIRSALHR